MPKTLTLWQTAPADSCEQNVRKRNKTPTKRQCPPHSSPLQKTDVSRKGEPNVNKKPCKKDVFCFHAAFSNVRRTCGQPVPKNGKTTSYRGEEMPKALFFHVNESPTASKKKNKTTAETPHGNTHKKSHAERHGTSSIEKKAPKTKGSILSDSRYTRIHYLRPLPSRLANTPFSSARK